ncbi:ATP-binding protein [Mesosutterella sp. OilRF-GAM-744-9]|uniref:histidine kinase n=1 Tax=Mesosutterella porci TaxID=2915351 RepID=A0ABS9MNQ2_9BURK|nr:ATP-binding protein [Mesosutterella sp. oilRF-744-WT-GAM-9]MCG5030249.1 ATP-binding protein [Mesosutterella sp. oilRF-744-WT-GAM-9]MCI6530305.1 ATP-binding protein [Mesosutterella sp.]
MNSVSTAPKPRSASLKRFDTVFWRMLAAFLAAMVLSGIFVFTIVLGLHSSQIPSNPGSRDRLVFASQMAGIAGKAGLTQWLKEQKTPVDRSYVYVVDESGKDLAGRPISASLVKHAREMYAQDPNSGDIVQINLEGRPVLAFTVRNSSSFLSESRFLLSRPLWPNIIASLLVAVAVASGMAWSITRPIRKIEQAMDKVTAGDLSVRVSQSVRTSSVELQSLSQCFDKMAGTIEQLLERQQTLFHNVSHELRSPLARMNCAIDIARQSPEKIPAMLDHIESDVKKMDALIDDLLTYTRLNAADLPLERENHVVFDAGETLQDVIDSAGIEASRKKVSIRAELPDSPLRLTGNSDILTHALENIIRNAIRFSPEQGVITCRAWRSSADRISLAIEDQGPGADPKELPTLFVPFFRGAGQPTGSGFGLGLAIAREAAKRFGGSIAAENIRPHGLRVLITLPALSEPAATAKKN